MLASMLLKISGTMYIYYTAKKGIWVDVDFQFQISLKNRNNLLNIMPFAIIIAYDVQTEQIKGGIINGYSLLLTVLVV